MTDKREASPRPGHPNLPPPPPPPRPNPNLIGYLDERRKLPRAERNR